MNAREQIIHAALLVAVKTTIEYLEQDPEMLTNEAMDLLKQLTPKNWYVPQRAALKTTLSDPASNWHTLCKGYYSLPTQERGSFLQTILENDEQIQELILPDVSAADIKEALSLIIEAI